MHGNAQLNTPLLQHMFWQNVLWYLTHNCSLPYAKDRFPARGALFCHSIMEWRELHSHQLFLGVLPHRIRLSTVVCIFPVCCVQLVSVRTRGQHLIQSTLYE
uniref:ORF59 n=1 Tax=Malaco herpesvirus 4 TaxID=3031800 RepID=A0AA48SF22_9VIRU|nr:TPA_asm: ORF59 [Malaco herpesvirus 4]